MPAVSRALSATAAASALKFVVSFPHLWSVTVLAACSILHRDSHYEVGFSQTLCHLRDNSQMQLLEESAGWDS